jgi:hypothetical protein
MTRGAVKDINPLLPNLEDKNSRAGESLIPDHRMSRVSMVMSYVELWECLFFPLREKSV